MAAPAENPLVSTLKSTSGLQVVLHPLVLLTVSDYITRHAMRQQKQAIVCALLGQQNGRDLTIEHAFDCMVMSNDAGEVILHEDWFTSRLDQMKQVHQDQQLDLVGWATLLPESGPTPNVLPIHNQILSKFNESAILLAFHPDAVDTRAVGGKLPLTLYESNYEVDDAHAQHDGEDQTMKDIGDGHAAGTLKLKFSELPYSVETGEAEMISMDDVARSAGSAGAVADTAKDTAASTTTQKVAVEVDGKGKKRIVSSEDSSKPASEESHLSKEDEEMIAALTAKANAVKMLQSRIKLLTAYLERLPAAFVEGKDAGIITDAMHIPEGNQTVPDYTILRSIQALVNRLPLIVPSAEDDFNKEILSESNDVQLITTLKDIIQGATTARTVGRTFALVDSSKNANKRQMVDYMGGGPGPTTSGAGDLMGISL